MNSPRHVAPAALLLCGILAVLGVMTGTANAQIQTVVFGNDTTTDGGILRRVKVDGTGQLFTAPQACTNAVQAVYLMDGGPLTIGQATARSYTVLCNSRDNTTGTIRCRADDGGVPVVTVGSVGDALSPGDCINYTNPVSKPIKCIGASTYLTSFECVP